MKPGKSLLITSIILLVYLAITYITAVYYGSNTVSTINGLALLLVGLVFALKKMKKPSLDTGDLEIIQTRLKRL